MGFAARGDGTHGVMVGRYAAALSHQVARKMRQTEASKAKVWAMNKCVSCEIRSACECFPGGG